MKTKRRKKIGKIITLSQIKNHKYFIFVGEPHTIYQKLMERNKEAEMSLIRGALDKFEQWSVNEACVRSRPKPKT